MRMLPQLMASGLPAGTGADRDTGEGGQRLSGYGPARANYIQTRAVIIATDGTAAATLAPGLVPPAWHPVTTFYYRLPSSPLGAPVLVIDGQGELLLNAAVLSDVAPGYAPPGAALVAASVPGRADPGLDPRSGPSWPACTTPAPGTGTSWRSTPSPAPCPSCAGQSLARPVRLGPGRYVCGDHRDTPSIQGALVSGRRAAHAVVTDLHLTIPPPDGPEA